MKHEGGGDSNCNCRARYFHQKVQGLDDLEIKGRVDTIQTTALLRSDRILRRVLETGCDLLSLRLPRKPIN